jgi:hypothetical protein
MAEMKIMDSVIPFKCDNPDCGKVYDQDSFAKAIVLWGFMILFSEENETALVGLTCTDCKKTSLNKYWASEGIGFLYGMWRYLKENGLVGSDIEFRNGWFGKYFSAQHLIESELIDGPWPNTDPKDKIVYSIPQDITLEKYSKKLNNSIPFTLIEDDIPEVLEIENGQSYKAILRTVPNPGRISNGDFNDYGIDRILLNPDHETINTVLTSLIEPNYSLYEPEYEKNPIAPEFPKTTWHRKDLTAEEENQLLDQNSLLVEERDGFELSPYSWKRKSFQDNVDNFLNDSRRIRNKVDCEQIVVNRLINKYARILYGGPQSFEEARTLLREVVEMEEADTPLSYIIDEEDIPDPTAPELVWYIDGGKLMDRWNMTANEILNLIRSRILFAHDSISSKKVTNNSLKPKFVAGLTMGNVDQQKLAMQRLQFNQAFIEDFEKKYPEIKARLQYNDQTVAVPSRKMTPKELLQENLRELAKKMRAQNPEMTFISFTKTKEYDDCIKGYEDLLPTTERGLRNWFKEVGFDPKSGRRPGT